MVARPEDPAASFDPTREPEPMPPPPLGGELYDKQISASEWFQATGLRRRVLEEGLLSVRCIANETHGKLMRLERSGYVRKIGEHGYALTPEGAHTIDWAGAPKPTFLDEQRWAGELARAIARHYCVEVHAMLRTAREGIALRARARLCFALFARGWPVNRIGSHFGIERPSVESAINLWRRERARLAAETLLPEDTR